MSYWMIEVLCKSETSEDGEWRVLHPTDGEPYQFATKEKAMRAIYYPSWEMGLTIRFVEVEK